MSMMLGGMRMPRQPPAQITPAAKLVLYFARSIDGKASNPINVTTAPMMPVAVANKAQVASAAIAIDPGKRRAAICSVTNNRSTMFDRSTM